jgi:hypothetical protein
MRVLDQSNQSWEIKILIQKLPIQIEKDLREVNVGCMIYSLTRAVSTYSVDCQDLLRQRHGSQDRKEMGDAVITKNVCLYLDLNNEQ